ncbi:hypothetical protein NHX12_009895 [Muraenolepis orangiensis]|uniref:DIX domain-containing protein n=1 Tax=Muraenolepis orangiensis TaxID=630683 RepID=A0A9Q0I6S8_9TELE|nr:hypothetical protein NHX12_009895 [Muraenolepis orangiensis]
MIASLSKGSSLDDVLHGGFNELKRKSGLKPISNLRLDLQDGVVLSHLIEIVDIVDGNLKSLMRIILALAAHFKPSANQRAASGGGRNARRVASNHNPLSAVALVQGASAALASARHDASLPVRHSHLRSGLGVDEEGNVCVRALVKQYERGSPEDTDTTQPRGEPINRGGVVLCSLTPPTSPPPPPVQLSGTGGKTTWDDTMGESLEKEMEEARQMVSALQALLLNGALPEEEEQTTLGLEEDDAQQQLRELLGCKQELRNLQGVKEAQQQRMSLQEASILQMKQEVLRSGMAREELTNQNAELQWKLEECTRLWSECKKEAGQKDRLLQQHKHKLEESQKQQSELQRELEHKGNTLQSLRGQDNQQAEELQLVRDAVRSLRNSFRDQDPQHHTLDTLEQGGQGKSPRHRITTPDPDPWPTKISHSFSSSSSSSTKVLYFTNRSSTPSMVTLRDVKEAVDCEGNLRYHFKALDPEFGTVKEELFLDGAIVPGWEGKIVAWVEEDHGEDR